MKLSAENGDYGKLYDADGNKVGYPDQLYLPVTADTETGEVLCYACDEKGNVKIEAGGTVEVMVQAKPPLRFDRSGGTKP